MQAGARHSQSPTPGAGPLSVMIYWLICPQEVECQKLVKNRPFTFSAPHCQLSRNNEESGTAFGVRLPTRRAAPMSALGHKRTFQGFRAMSALPSKADLKADIFEVCRCPLSAKRSSFDALALSAISSEAT